ncbi:SDR family oxidoreductase [Mycobacterium sp. NPDC003323]
MHVLLTGGDTDLGRHIAGGFRDAGHSIIIAGFRRDDLEVAAKELDVDFVVFDNTDPASLEAARGALPQHLDGIINVPAPRWDAGDPRTQSLADRASAWRHALDTTVLSAVLTVTVLGDQLSSGGSILNVIPQNPADGTADAAIKAAVSNWTAGQAAHFGIRGITINAVAAGRGAEPGYNRAGTSGPSTADEITRLALFLTTPAARHITGETLHVSQGALASFG